MSSMVSSSVGGLGSLAGGIAGNIAAGPDRGAAAGAVSTGMNAYGEAQVPMNLANPYNFQNYQVAGQLNPALQQTINAAPSQAAGVQGNQNLVNAQMQALNTLKGASQTGLTSADRSRLNQIQNQMATQAEGQRQAIMQNYAQRGQAGSGNQLLAELNASQNAAQTANQNSLQAAGQAQNNALNALSQYGNQAGEMNTQQFGQQMQAAQAQDALNRFNVQNQVQQQAANVGAQNAAQQFNLQNQQGAMNANTGLANQNQIMQRQNQQQIFQDQMAQAGGISGAQFTGANALNNMGNQIAQGWSNIGQGAGQALGGTGGGGSSGSGGGGSGLAGGILGAFMANGGVVPSYADGGSVSGDPNSLLYGSLTNMPGVGPVYQMPNASPKQPQQQQQPSSNVGSASPWEVGGGLAGGPMDNSSNNSSQQPSPGAQMADFASQQVLNAAHGGEINQYGTDGQTYSNGGVAGISTTSRGTYPAYQHGGYLNEGGMLATLAAKGGHVPGKAVVKGDSLRNDRVPVRLSPGEVVVPRSIIQSSDPVMKSAQFVKRILEQKKGAH